MVKERVTMRFFERMGLPAPREAHARLYVNDQYVGLYAIVESVDKRFLRRNFREDDGYLYEYDWQEPYFFQYRGSDPLLYSPKPFRPETRVNNPDPRPIEAMIRTMDPDRGASDTDFTRAIAEFLDLKLFMAHVAIENFLAEWDGILGHFGLNNFYFYRFVGKNLSQFIVWDKDTTFGGFIPERRSRIEYSIWQNVQDNVLMRRSLAVPELRDTYLSTLVKSAETAGGPGGWLEQEITRQYNLIRTAAREDTFKQCPDAGLVLRSCSNEEFEAEVAFLLEFARQRSDFVLNAVAVEGFPAPSSRHAFTIPDRGGSSWMTAGGSGSTVVGYTRIQPDPESTAPSGLAIFGLRQNDVLVAETAVPASPPIQNGRIYAEVNGPVNTGLAIANPNSEPATISSYFTDANGRNFGQASITIPANGQIAKFLNEAPFNAGPSFSGTLTFSSPVSVSAIALRGLTNERSEFLITTLPVTELPATSSEAIIFPHFADGGGWKTQVVLVNPTDEVIAGTVQFFGQGSPTAAALPVTITVDGQTTSTFTYAIPPRSSRRFETSGSAGGVRVGSIRVTPSANNKSPAGLGIFSFKNAGITVTESGVPVLRAGSAFRLYSEYSGNFNQAQIGSIQTGVAIANPSATAVTVNFELTRLAGEPVGLTGTAVVPGLGQVVRFLNQISGFESLQAPFQGVLRITTSAPSGISVVGLRGRYNERKDFLITTTPPVSESGAVSTTELFFPHLAEAGGYSTQFIIFSGSPGMPASGVLRFFSQAGQPLNLLLR